MNHHQLPSCHWFYPSFTQFFPGQLPTFRRLHRSTPPPPGRLLLLLRPRHAAAQAQSLGPPGVARLVAEARAGHDGDAEMEALHEGILAASGGETWGRREGGWWSENVQVLNTSTSHVIGIEWNIMEYHWLYRLDFNEDCNGL